MTEADDWEEIELWQEATVHEVFLASAEPGKWRLVLVDYSTDNELRGGPYVGAREDVIRKAAEWCRRRRTIHGDRLHCYEAAKRVEN